MPCVVYRVRDITNDETIYIGATTAFSNRKHNYYTPSPHAHMYVVKYMRSFEGWRERFAVERVSTHDSKEEMLAEERRLISTLQPKCNITYNSKNKNIVPKDYNPVCYPRETPVEKPQQGVDVSFF